VAKAKQSSWQERKRRSSKPKQRVELFRIAKQMKRVRQKCYRRNIKNKKGEIKVNEKEIMKRWKEYFSELLNELSEYQLDGEAKVEGPLKITEKEVKAALKGMKKGKTAGPTGVTICYMT